MSNIETLYDIISKILLIEKKDITDLLSQNDIEEWDSLSHLVLISEIETSFSISLTDEEVVDIQTIGDLKSVLNDNGISV